MQDEIVDKIKATEAVMVQVPVAVARSTISLLSMLIELSHDNDNRAQASNARHLLREAVNKALGR